MQDKHTSKCGRVVLSSKKSPSVLQEVTSGAVRSAACLVISIHWPKEGFKISHPAVVDMTVTDIRRASVGYDRDDSVEAGSSG